MATTKTNTKADITISNSGSGFYGFTGETAKGRKWIDRFVYGADRGQAWSDDRSCAMEIADGAVEAGLKVK